MKLIVNRRNKQFCIDTTQLSSKANNTDVINALYAAIYLEFRGASENPKYKHLTYLERFNKLNEFANKWLKDRGLD